MAQIKAHRGYYLSLLGIQCWQYRDRAKERLPVYVTEDNWLSARWLIIVEDAAGASGAGFSPTLNVFLRNLTQAFSLDSVAWLNRMPLHRARQHHATIVDQEQLGQHLKRAVAPKVLSLGVDLAELTSQEMLNAAAPSQLFLQPQLKRTLYQQMAQVINHEH